MKRHGPNSPLTIRGLRDRYSQRGNLDARAQMEADLGTAEMVGPWGKGFDLMKNPGGSQTYIVGNLAGGTLAPGASGLVGNTSGRPGALQRLGRSPAGKKGPGNAARSARRRGSVTTPANQYAFGSDGLGSMLAMLYADGVYVSTRATETEISGAYTGCILSDSSLVLGDGALLLHDTTSLKVWDVENAAFYSYAVPSGWVNPTALYYQGGYLGWCEFEEIPQAEVGTGDATFDYRLRKAATDLTSVTTVATVTSANASTFGVPFTAYDHPPEPWAFGVDADGAILYMGFEVTEIINYETIEWHGLQSRFATAGGAPSTRAWTLSELGDGIDNAPPTFAGGFPAATIGTSSLAICAPEPALHSVLSKSDDASSAAASLWGDSDLDAITGLLSFNVGTGGAVLQVCAGTSGGAEALYRGVGGGTVVTETIEPFDEVPNTPTAFYYYGE